MLVRVLSLLSTRRRRVMADIGGAIGVANLHRLRADRSGVATLEFALWTVLLFMVVLVGLDFGIYHIQSTSVDEGVTSAAVHAFDTRDGVDLLGIAAYVRAVSGDTALTVTTTCNGTGACTNTGRTCACLDATGGYVPTNTCGEACTASGMTSGSTSGYYLTIRAAGAFKATLVPSGMLNGAQISRRATVRLQ